MSTRKSNLQKMTKLRHSSLELADSDLKKTDMLTKARSKLLNFSDAFMHRKIEEPHGQTLPKSMTQCTLDYFFKHSQHKAEETMFHPPKAILQKQTSVGSYPQIRVSSFEEDDDEDFHPLNRLRPATVCVDRPSVDRRSDAEALALERPRKKLSFKEPEVDTSVRDKQYKTLIKNKSFLGNKQESRLQNTLKSCEKILRHSKLNGKNGMNNNEPGDKNFSLGKGIQSIAGLGLSVVTNGVHKTPSYEDCELESQAMRIVRTVGQAFEVCHKLSIGAPEDNYDDEQDTTLTQDLLSDRLSDVASDKPKKDVTLDGANSDKNSLPPDDSSLKDSYAENSISKSPGRIDILPPPHSNNNNSSRKSPLHAETYASPNSDSSLKGNTNPPPPLLPPPGSALSAHHEIQLLREQLEQQRQQTQAAVAQLQLVREQMQAEQTARMEAQARTHQLLVHNKELLDHIAALVAHFPQDKPEHQSSPPHMTMPQLSSAAKVERWFELLEPLSISRPESGFVSCQDNEFDDEKEILEGTRNLLSKLSARKQRKLLGLKLGKVTTF